VRLLNRVLIRVQPPKKPPQKFLCHVRRWMLRLPGRVTCRQVSRDRPSHEKTCARWCARDVDCVRLKRAAMVAVVPPSHAHGLACDPSVVPNSGPRPYGLAMCWNGAHSRAEQGLERATRAWSAGTHHRASPLRVAQTSVAPHRRAEATRLEASLAQRARGVTPQPVPARNSLAVDGSCRQQTCVDGSCAWD
jgi:hypothetical protein